MGEEMPFCSCDITGDRRNHCRDSGWGYERSGRAIRYWILRRDLETTYFWSLVFPTHIHTFTHLLPSSLSLHCIILDLGRRLAVSSLLYLLIIEIVHFKPNLLV